MTRVGLHAALVGALLVVLGIGSYAIAGGSSKNVRANLSGFQEVPLVVTGAEGTFRGTLDANANTLAYTLTYANAESPVTQAHIHIGQRFAVGGITLWLCSNAAPNTPSPPTAPTPPACPTPGGTVSGVLGPANITGPASQGIVNAADAATELAEWNQLEQVLRAGLTYANVHSQVSPGGEIRGQIRGGRGGDD